MDLADALCIRSREAIEIHFIQIKNHGRKREQMIKNRGKKILDRLCK
ncbi:MAG: hypothetical protein HFP81_07980 [Methylococcales symbiont of Hymedesmia sp. n. MRB-2018]|nr:MAG: hypothetical protein HFP78_08215 [Methylococcales symbiont of Hymedesmia sp. n. MRB-2018]KAF3983299.1 MAG: hypothetical protein HFP81_07980 [Methylococcales symbiont of Hymedesmia sp. n. MRB-2018]